MMEQQHRDDQADTFFGHISAWSSIVIRNLNNQAVAGLFLDFHFSASSPFAIWMLLPSLTSSQGVQIDKRSDFSIRQAME